MKFNHLKEHASNTAHLAMLVVVVIVSTASVISLNPRSMADLGEKSNDAVKGISTLDTQAVRFEQFVGNVNGVNVENYQGEGQNYLSKVFISQTSLPEIEQGIVKISNDSYISKEFKLILRSDPNALLNYETSLKIEGTLIPIDMYPYGFVESVITVEPGEMETIGLHIRRSDYGFVENLGFEIELVNL